MKATAINEGPATSDLRTQSETLTPISFHVTREAARWNLAPRIAFRVVFAYFVLYSFPTPLDYLGLPSLFAKYDALWTAIVTWIAKHWFGLNITVLPNGSGDTTYNYVQVLCMLVLAATATLIWSLLDRKRGNYEKLHEWLRLYVRVVLGLTLMVYGSIKLIQSQMPPPSLSTLIETYGQSSPMHLLWTFMGASRGYNAFAGGVEMLGGVLLFVPAFTTLGALVSIGAMSNVFVLNMCYDVPVKLYSFHLLLMAIFLVTPDARRLAELFLFHRRVELYSGPPLFRRRWARRSLLAAQLLLGLGFATMCLYTAHAGQKTFRSMVSPQLYGIWSVDDYQVDGKAVPQSATAEPRWQRVFLEYSWRLVVEPNSGPRQRLFMTLDEKKHTLNLTKYDDPKSKADLTYQTPQPGLLIVTGQMDGHRVDMRLHQLDIGKSFLLTSRGFHWINEYPFNQ